MRRKPISTIASTAACLIVLTFAIPATQWLASRFISHTEYRGIISSIAIILSVGLWLRKTNSPLVRNLSSWWKIFYSLAIPVILGLLIFNIHQQPIAKISGQPRSPWEVFDLIVLLPMAEELVFRGAIWSRLEKFGAGLIAVLASTSLLFGIEHLGYWAQTNWPLPSDAYLHTFSMIFAGIFFGFFRFKIDSLATPAVLHMLANGAILLTQ